MWQVIAAFAAIYLIWGSTFLGMRLAINSIPPFLMSGGRYVIAGSLLYAVMRWMGAAAPNWKQWLNSFFTGGLLVTAGNGCVCWAQQTVPTGIAALLVASVPLWILLADWWRPNGIRPSRLTVLGLMAGFAGVSMIALGKDHTGSRLVDPLGVSVLLMGTMCWAIGSIYARQTKIRTESKMLGVSLQMLGGGVLDIVIGSILGEWNQFHPSQFTSVSMWSFVYLTFIGSLVAYTAYVWLLGVSSPAKVSTYAYVNPVIAVVLGHVFLKEELPHSLALAGLLILAAVVLISAFPPPNPELKGKG